MSFAAPAFAPLDFQPVREGAQSVSMPSHDARNLTQGGSLARIMLDGQAYTLRITRAEKLILTK